MNIRKAIIICSQSRGNTNLPGVYKDAEKFVKFLMSPNGGALDMGNIIILRDPTCQQVINIVHGTNADFLQVYVSSHGSTDRDGNRLIHLIDGSLYDTDLLNQCLKQVIFIDACRNHIEKEPATIGGIGELTEQWKNADGSSNARKWFDIGINFCPVGKWIIHGTQDNRSAFETSDGGVFTVNLLEEVADLQHTGRHEYINLEPIFNLTSKRMAVKRTKQYPEFVFGEDASLVPFAIISPTFITIHRKIVNSNQIHDNGIKRDLTKLGLLGLGIFIISKL